MSDSLPIQILIETRLRDLGLTRGQFARRTGYKNPGKALRRLDMFIQGNTKVTTGLIKVLPSALDIAPEQIETAIRETEAILDQRRRDEIVAAEAAWRESFVPHAIVATERSRPEPIHVAVLMGPDNLLRVDFDYSGPKDQYLAHAMHAVIEHIDYWGGRLPAFGKITGFYLNYSPDFSERYDLYANLISTHPQAKRIGRAVLSYV